MFRCSRIDCWETKSSRFYRARKELCFFQMRSLQWQDKSLDFEEWEIGPRGQVK